MKVLVWISFVLSLFFSCSGKEAQECGTLQDGDLTTVCRVVGERNRFLLNWSQELKGEVLSPEKIRATTGGIASPPSFACTNHSKTALSLSLFVGRASVCACMASYLHYPTHFS